MTDQFSIHSIIASWRNNYVTHRLPNSSAKAIYQTGQMARLNHLAPDFYCDIATYLSPPLAVETMLSGHAAMARSSGYRDIAVASTIQLLI